MTGNSFREIAADALSPHRLQHEMQTHGYALVRGCLSPSSLQRLLSQVRTVLAEADWCDAERTANSRASCSNDDHRYKSVYEQMFKLQALHALPHCPVLARMMTMLTGPELLIHPIPVMRLIFPRHERGVIHAHQDHTAIGGDAESYTAWIPLHDCPIEEGALRILDGSHLFGLQPTAGQTGYIPPGAEQGEGWVAGEIRCGDVLLFHSLTVHEAVPNRSNRLRVSLDLRFQSYLRAINPATLVFAGSGRRSWTKVYDDWTSDELKFYWKRLPLHLQPSRVELAQLASTSATPGLCERYARILQEIEAQMSEPAGTP